MIDFKLHYTNLLPIMQIRVVYFCHMNWNVIVKTKWEQIML